MIKMLRLGILLGFLVFVLSTSAYNAISPDEITIQTEYMSDIDEMLYAKYTAAYRNTILWEYTTPPQSKTMLTANDYFKIDSKLILPVDSNLYALDINTGKLLWIVEGTGVGINVVTDEENNIYVTSFNNPDLSIISNEGELLRRVDNFVDNVLERPISVEIIGDYIKIVYSSCSSNDLDYLESIGIFTDTQSIDTVRLYCIYANISDLLSKPSINYGLLTPLSKISPLGQENILKASLNKYIESFLTWPVFFVEFDSNNINPNELLRCMFRYRFYNNELVEAVETNPLEDNYDSLFRTTDEKFQIFCEAVFGVQASLPKEIFFEYDAIFRGTDGNLYDGTWIGGNGGADFETYQVQTIEPTGDAKFNTYYLEFEIFSAEFSYEEELGEIFKLYNVAKGNEEDEYLNLPMSEWVFGGQEYFKLKGRGSAIVRGDGKNRKLRFIKVVLDVNDTSYIMPKEKRLAYVQDLIPASSPKPISPPVVDAKNTSLDSVLSNWFSGFIEEYISISKSNPYSKEDITASENDNSVFLFAIVAGSVAFVGLIVLVIIYIIKKKKQNIQP